jgi:hypothetical protein
MSNLLQASQIISPELALSGTEYDYGEELVGKFCGCLLTIERERLGERTIDYGNTNTVCVVSFAHYTVWEFLISNRIRDGPIPFFAVDAGSTKMDFAEMLIRNALDLEIYKTFDWERPSGPDGIHRTGILDKNFVVFSIMGSFISVVKWCHKICERDDLSMLAFDLLDPSKPHFKELSKAAMTIEEGRCLFSGWENSIQFWHIGWLKDPELSQVKTFINWLLTNHYGVLSAMFLKIHDMQDVMQTQIHLEINVRDDTDVNFEPFVTEFEGSIREFCQAYFIPCGLTS